MDIIAYSIKKPISITVVVLLIALFGLVGVSRLPVQLTPDVEEMKITVRTMWPGASPYEVEKEIIEEQEKVLKGLRGLLVMESSSYNNFGNITLTFTNTTELENALLRVSNKLNEVPRYPDNAEKPIIEAAGAESSPVVWTELKIKDGDDKKIDTYRTFFENEIRQHIERVPGVASLFVFGGTEKQLDIVIDPEKLARHNITISEAVDKIRRANTNRSAGVIGIDKNHYRIRTISRFQTPEDPLDVVIYDDGVKRVLLRDIADSRIGYEKKTVAVMLDGENVIAVGIRKEPGANVLDMVDRLHVVIDRLNETLLAENNLYLHWSYDQSPYIRRSIDIVQINLLIGGMLAICVLLLFLRSTRATLATAVAIPISVIGCFIFLWIFDRNINVVSLAGISFAVGMLVDNSIVVLENIDRHRKMNKPTAHAVYDGAREVWGAIFASTATTVAVFLPVVFIRQEAGQLFKDIAIAIAFAIIISLFVSVSVIPSMMNQLYKSARLQQNRLSKRIGNAGQGFSNGIMRLSGIFLHSTATRFLTVVGFSGASVLLVWLLLPKAEYLPHGNQNVVFNVLVPPPGYSFEKRMEIGNYIFRETKPYYEQDGLNGVPQLEEMWYVSADQIMLAGATCIHETKARKMIPMFNRIINSIPGMYGISMQGSIFADNIGKGRTIDVDFSGKNIDELVAVARTAFGAISQKIRDVQIRPIPSLEISYPEANIIPRKKKMAASGLTEEELGTYVDILMDGRKIDEYRPEGVRQIDLVLKGSVRRFQTPEDILDCTIVNRFNQLIRIRDVAEVQYAEGMLQIDHLEQERNIRLQVTPPESVALQAAMEIIEQDIIPRLKQDPAAADVSISVGGNADKLTETRRALQWNFLLAVVITYLLMSALFENFFYPFIIMFTVPLAAAGGFLGLWLVNLLIAPQSFDVLVMLGFIILVGTVVNNAILIVHQALNNVRNDGMGGMDAIFESVRTRIRPIFMSATTSIFGLLPLVLSSGSGSELYRGLGSVLLGGLALSTVFTLFVTPALLSFFIRFESKNS